ncbi:MAG: serine/threonine-protein kinase [Planctomycetota bacterium]|jgi:serine/threonine protein kinase|nr:serine/threonine-protein kinase [Planctomycetota bacterium]
MGSIVIPGYQVAGKIKDGGFSSVYRGRRIADGRDVALKVLSETARRDSFASKSFRHEARVLRHFNHPNVIGFCEFLTSTSRPVLVLDYFQGESIKSLLYRKSALPHNHLIQLFQKSVEALGHMHGKGFIHRDVKPENILLGPEGEVRLIDFSLAQKQNLFSRISLFGRKKRQGTPLYMAPEQIRLKPIDPRTDFYGLGATMYEVITGSPPFPGASTEDILAKHLRDKPRPIEDESLPRPLRELVLRLLSKKPERRPETQGEILSILNRFQDPVHLSTSS